MFMAWQMSNLREAGIDVSHGMAMLLTLVSIEKICCKREDGIPLVKFFSFERAPKYIVNIEHVQVSGDVSI